MILSPQLVERIQEIAVQLSLRGERSFYVYDSNPMSTKIAHLKAVLPKGVEIFYAMKANPHSAFLLAARSSQVAGVEIASIGEGKLALEASFSADQLIFTGPGKSPEELRWSVKNQIGTIHIESLTEAYRLNTICREYGTRQDVLLRVNPDFFIHGAQANFSGGSSKFGVDETKLFHTTERILSQDHLNFRGLHVYAASGVLEVENLLKNCELVFIMARSVEERFPNVRCDIIDFGGGFGIDYLETGNEFSPDSYANGLQRLIEDFNFSDRKFVLELGRYLVADSGWYCTEILDIKESLGKKQCVSAGGSNHFRRPVAVGINHPVKIVSMNREKLFYDQEEISSEMVAISGPLCNSEDKLAHTDVFIEKAQIGDILVVGFAGAYGLTMSHIEFLSHQRPREMIIFQGDVEASAQKLLVN